MKSLLRLLPYLSKYKRTLYLGLITVIISNLFAVATPWFIGEAVDELKRGLEAQSLGHTDLLWYSGLVVGFSIIAGVMLFFTRQTIIVVSRKIEYDLRNDFLSHIQKLPLSYFQNTPTGDLMAHATNDISAVRNVVGPGIMYPADTLMTLSMSLMLMFVKDWQLTLLALIPMPFVSYAVYYLGKVIHEKFNERQEQYSVLTTKAQENLSGARVVKAYVREEYEIEQFRKASWEYFKKNLVLAKAQSIMWPLMFILVGLSIIITIYMGGLKVINGEMTIGTLTAFMTYLSLLIWPMIAFGWVTNMWQQGAASMKRLGKIFDTVPTIRNTEQTDASIESIEGTIEFNNVSFTHETAQKPTLQNISLTIPNGSTLAIVGYTGAGKSSLVNLIPRLYDVTDGSLLIDGIDIKKIPLEVLRKYIGYVPQETFLFSDSIAENIRYGDDEAQRELIHEAADVSQIAKDVADFPQRFETMLGERGITLSGGQKQRTSIARAILRRPKIMILDDALSAVDTYTEETILQRLRTVMEGRTSIIIAHRISTVKDADHIIVLHEGKIAEQGTHDQLVAVKGIYASLYQKQLLEKELENL
ncbi:MAG: ABC transporter ATP-binding protein [Bacteriovoracaceae bacterium]|nr:ABC transporter ATP-binding protein/permease [Bacteroidota bacterium]